MSAFEGRFGMATSAMGRQLTAGRRLQAGGGLLADAQRATATEPEPAIAGKRHSCSNSKWLRSELHPEIRKLN